MKVSLFTLGTTGDVDPVIALATRLAREGFQVQACSVDLHEERFRRAGLDFRCVGESGIQPRNMDESFDRLLKSANPLHQFAVIAELLLHKARERYPRCVQALESTDLAICHIIDIVGIAAARECGVPWASMRFDTLGLATSTRSPFHNDFGPWVNRLLWKTGQWAFDRKVDPIVRGSLPEVLQDDPGLKMFRTYSPNLNLIAVSPELSPRPPDLPETFHIVGSWALDDSERFEPSPELASFLAAHPKPAVVTFGSVAGSALAPLIETCVAALEEGGIPAIVQLGCMPKSSHRSAHVLPVIGYLPHSFLFKKAAFVIHHGGSGTSAAACSAGVASIVIPHNSDQFYWGHRLYQLGVAPKPVRRSRVNRERLGQLIKELEENPGYHVNAGELGTKLRREDGLGTATRLIAQLAGTLRVRERRAVPSVSVTP